MIFLNNTNTGTGALNQYKCRCRCANIDGFSAILLVYYGVLEMIENQMRTDGASMLSNRHLRVLVYAPIARASIVQNLII